MVDSETVRVIMKKIFFALLLFSTPVFSQSVVITEVMFRPLTNEAVNEYVEFFNTSFSDSVDISSWSVKDNLGTSNFVYQSGTKKVGPRSFALLVDATYFDAASSGLRDYDGLIPNNVPVYKTSNTAIGNALGNTADSIVLYSAQNGGGSIISKLKWTITTSTAGISIEKINTDLTPFEIYPSSNTGFSTTSKGTPGFQNSISPLDYDVELTTLQLTPASPNVLDSITVKAVISNKGTQALTNFTYSIFADTSINQSYENNEKFYTTTMSLASGSSVELIRKIKPGKTGSYSVKAVVSSNKDTKTSNDFKTQNITVSDVVLYDVGISNLTIPVKTHYYKKDSLSVSVEVTNYGIRTAKNLTLSIRDNYSIQKNILIDSIEAGKQVQFQKYWSLTTIGQLTLTAKISFNEDTNHSNDSTQKNITVEKSNYQTALSLSEIMYNPTGAEGNNQNEFVEIFNTSSIDTVDLTGFYIKDASTVSNLVSHSGGLLLPPRKYAVIHPPTYYSTAVRLYDGIEDTVNTIRLKTVTSSIGNGLTSTNDAVYLFSSAGDTIDSHSWTTDSGDGFSVEKKDLDVRKNLTNWNTSKSKNGSPGKVNSLNIFTIDGKIEADSIVAVWPGNEISIPFRLVNQGKQTITQAEIKVYEDSDFNLVPDQLESIGNSLMTNLFLTTGSTTNGSVLINKTFSKETQFLVDVNISGDENLTNNRSVTKLAIRLSRLAVMISEVMFDPINSSSDFLKNQPEYIEIYNTTNNKIQLKGWTISDQINENGQSNKLTISDSIYIYPHSYTVISNDSTLLTFWNYFSHSDTSTTFTILNRTSLNLNNDADAVIIYDSFQTTIDSLFFNSSWHNSSYSTTKGVSLERRSFSASTNDPYNWSSSSNFPSGGTPGKPNSIAVGQSNNGSSVIFSPNPFSPDGDGFEDVAGISYQLNGEVHFVKIRIFDRLGRIICELKNYSPSGSKGQLFWDGKNQNGQIVPMGSYIVLIEGFNSENQNKETIKKVIVVAKKL